MPTPLPSGLVWHPNPGPQTFLITCPIEEILYGGARGGGKSDGILGDWISHVFENPKHAKGIIFRQSYPELEQLIARSLELFPRIGGRWREGKKTWVFPGGATLKFRFIESLKDAEKYQGHEYTFIAFDEIGNYPSPDVVNLLRACLRSSKGVSRFRFILTANPLGKGHAWLKKRYIDPAPPLTVIKDVEEIKGVARTTRRVFIPAKLEDNPKLVDADPDYDLRLLEATAGKPWLYKAWRFGDWQAVQEVQGALWKQEVINQWRLPKAPDLYRIVVGVDPSISGKATSDDCGIIVVGMDTHLHRYVLDDFTIKASPRVWASHVVKAFHKWKADRIVAEMNQGGEMVRDTIDAVEVGLPIRQDVYARKGKHLRAEPTAALYEQGRFHHVGTFAALEDEQTTWVPLSGDRSPNRIDALVWADTELREGSVLRIR